MASDGTTGTGTVDTDTTGIIAGIISGIVVLVLIAGVGIAYAIASSKKKEPEFSSIRTAILPKPQADVEQPSAAANGTAE